MIYIYTQSGPLAAPIGVEGNAFVATSFANNSWPDIQIMFVSLQAGFDGGTGYKDFLGITEKVCVCISIWHEVLVFDQRNSSITLV